MKRLSLLTYTMIIVGITTLLFFTSCDNAKEIVLRSNCEINSITIRSSISGTEYLGKITDDQIVFVIPSSARDKVDITKLYVVANLPIEAAVKPSLSGLKDLSSPYDITVTAGDGSKKNYTLIVMYE